MSGCESRDVGGYVDNGPINFSPDGVSGMVFIGEKLMGL